MHLQEGSFPFGGRRAQILGEEAGFRTHPQNSIFAFELGELCSDLENILKVRVRRAK